MNCIRNETGDDNNKVAGGDVPGNKSTDDGDSGSMTRESVSESGNDSNALYTVCRVAG